MSKVIIFFYFIEKCAFFLKIVRFSGYLNFYDVLVESSNFCFYTTTNVDAFCAKKLVRNIIKYDYCYTQHIPPMYFSCCEAKLLLGNCLDGRVLTQIPITKWSCAFAIRYSYNLWTGICKTNIFGEVSTVRHTSFGAGP